LAASESSFSAAGTSKREEEESRVLSEPDPTSGMTEPTGGSDDEAKTLSVGEASPYVDHSLLPMSVFMDLSVNRFFFFFFLSSTRLFDLISVLINCFLSSDGMERQAEAMGRRKDGAQGA
jgi:hypothetical protein